MLTIRLIERLDDALVVRMAALQEHLLRGKHGRPLDRALFQDCLDTGFLVGAWLEDFEAIDGAYPVPCETLVGMCYLFIHQTISRRVMLYEELVVDPLYRGRKVADRIDEYLITLAAAHACDCIEGCIPAGNEAVRTVHLRNGFSLREQYPFRLILHHF